MNIRLLTICLVCFLFTISACTTRTGHPPNNPLSPAAPGTTTNILSPYSKEAVLTPVGPTAQAGSYGDVAAKDPVKSFQVSGKVAVQTAKKSGSVNVSWTQHQRQFYMSLVGPMGSHHMVLQGVPGHVILQTSDGKRLQAGSPEELLAKGWGFQLPVSNLRFWIRGVPVPGIPQQTQYDSSHHLVRLVQQGWHIDYLGYTQQGLPQRLSMSSPGLRAKIVIYQWAI